MDFKQSRTKTRIGRVIIESSNQRLVEGFNWAKQQALAYIHDADPVGKWYEAALPGRDAFCMRDVSHQSEGAQVLGLQSYNKNMLKKFAESISESKDWCSYWEINKYNLPAPVDYTNDQDFWYNLPANFDVMDCCYRQYLWTGDRSYLDDPVFLNFYDHTVTNYVNSWDIDGDGLMEHLSKYGRRGLGSYHEGNEEYLAIDILTGGDLIAAQYAGYLAYANIQELRGNDSLAKEYRIKAKRLKVLFNNTWWDEDNQRYYGVLLQDYALYNSVRNIIKVMILYFGLPEEGRKANLAVGNLIKQSPPNVEAISYLPEVSYKYKHNDTAYTVLLELTDPNLKRREYPEVSYSVIGSIATGMIGFSPDARHNMISTISRLTKDIKWVTIQNVPVFGNEISVYHRGNCETTFTNQSGVIIYWKACFLGEIEELLLDGSVGRATQGIGINGQKESWIIIPVKQGEEHTVRMP